MPDVPCFLLTKTDRVRRSLRRYEGLDRNLKACPKSGSHHDASVFLDEMSDANRAAGDSWPHDDPRWPKACECGEYAFSDKDRWQLFVEHLWKRDSGEECTLREAPPGAMWYADWMTESIDSAKCGNLWRGPDGRCLEVRCPGGHYWMIDGRASNCTRRDDNIHKCWVRHGSPPLVTVDKDGNTCSAGAGSIQTPNWHGFLRQGVLTTG